MHLSTRKHIGVGSLLLLIQGARGATDPNLGRRFEEQVRPLIGKYCAGCHSGKTPAAQFDVQAYATADAVVRDFARWALVLRRLSSNEMPPKPAPQPSAADRSLILDWIEAVRAEEVRKNAGDPGPVLARRLSNAEYNYTVRDLTGADLRPAKEFPVDPANQAGFDNSGESLTTSPALMAKYLEAARQVADHLVLKPDGLAFSPWPALVETDRERYSIQRILDFYRRQPTDFADYFQAAWRYKYRDALGEPNASLATIAVEEKVSPRYLPLVWQALNQRNEDVGPLAKLQEMWRRLGTPAGGASISGADPAIRAECVEMRNFVTRIRRHTEKLFDPPSVPGMAANFQPFVVWRNSEIEAHRRDFDPTALRVEGEPASAKDFVVTRGPIFGSGEKVTVEKAIADYIRGRKEDPDLVVPAGGRTRYEAAFARFSSVFPTAFCLPERGRFYPVDSYDQGRYLGAGFHNVMGYFRDDAVLSELILDDKGKKELDQLWHDFDFVANYTARTWEQFLFNGGGGGRGLRVKKPTFDNAESEATILAMRDQYVAAVPVDHPEAGQWLTQYFNGINSELRWRDRARIEAEPLHIAALIDFAARAYRRPLEIDEREEILGYYHELRDKGKLSHEEAMRASIESILVSPDFLYRTDLAGGIEASRTRAERQPNGSAGVIPLSGYALASKLSYFLWSTMPDKELLDHAAAGDLGRPAVLQAQVRRMLKDERIKGFATEFAGNWLGFRGFESLNSVDRERFPSFNDELRQAMFEEPVRFFEYVLRNDRPVLDLLYGNYTFVNPVLAKHYGIPGVQGGADWAKVDNASDYGRGGILPMAVFLTMNAPGQRTSPVKRGYWVAKRVLGEVIPPPPPVVPELPHDEAKTDLPVRDLLAQHRANQVCAACHARFDSFGLAFENYGPVGERRTRDLAGRPVDTRAAFPGGGEGDGLSALQTYIRAHREKDFVDNLCEKMLVYALERSETMSDEPLLDSMRARLTSSDFRLSGLIGTIVASPQFLKRRAAPDPRGQTRVARR